MSVLEGGFDHTKVFITKNPYGPVLEESAFLKLDQAQDIAVNKKGDKAYVAGGKKLYILDMENPDDPKIISALEGLGAGRQIAIDEENGVACVTARADGLYICGISDPYKPVLLCHYDTVELATAVFVSGGYCFVGCRHLGIEIIDVKNPSAPVHVCSVLAGETQSICVEGRYMYAGAWMNRQIMIFDISDPAKPVHISSCMLDGFADGHFVRGGILYAATGHHSTRLVNRKKFQEYDFVTADMLNEGYGGGHGLEIFDITDRKNPVFLSRIKTPPLFMGGTDTWDVVVSGDHAFLSDTWNGLFIINVKDPMKPFFEGYKRLGVYNQTKYLRQPSVQQLCNAVNALVPVRDRILAVSVSDGLHVIEAEGKAALADTTAPYRPGMGTSGEDNAAAQIQLAGREYDAEINCVFRVKGQVHSVAFLNNVKIIAAGTQGIYILDSADKVISHTCTKGFAMDIKTDGRLIYLAEGNNGLSIWELTDEGDLKAVSECPLTGKSEASVRQVVLFSAKGIAALHLGSSSVAFVDISDPAAPALKKTFSGHGMMYYKNICGQPYKERYAAVVPLHPFTCWYDLSDKNDIKPNYSLYRDICPIEEGIAILDGSYLTVSRGKYFIQEEIAVGMPPEEERTEAKDKNGNPVYMSGWPRVIGDKLFLINRMNGEVMDVDISKINAPVLAGRFRLPENPEDIVSHNGAYWIPCGHAGLIKLLPQHK